MDKNAYLINISSRNQLRRCNAPPNHRPVCSLISQQHCHPRAGQDSPRNKEQVGLHIANDTQISQANTVGFIRPSRSCEKLNAKLVRSLKSKDTYTRTSLTSRTPTHTQHKEISPFSATQSLIPELPFQCYSGVVEKKANPLALSVWLPNTPGLSSKPSPHSHSNTVHILTTTYTQQNK